MTVRIFTNDDVDALCKMARRFIEETDIPLTYSEEVTQKTLRSMLTRPYEAIGLVSDHDGVLGGAVLGIVEQDFCAERLGFIMKFYVEKEFRGLGVSDDLLTAFENAAVALGARMIFASATAGMGTEAEKMYVRLFVRQGYNVLGRVLVKECT